MQDSRATDGTLIYADIGPTNVKRVQNTMAAVPDDSTYRVQYAEINYNAKAPQNLCVPDSQVTLKIYEAELKSGSHI